MTEFGTLSEIFVILVAALILLGPKEIPTVLRGIGRSLYQIKKIMRHVHNHINPYIQEGEFESFKNEVNKPNLQDSSSTSTVKKPRQKSTSRTK